ncbi:MAG: hypothetical protein K2L42_03155 [Clostridia bacterium]|nr:hypothetical protein [Clostridia bacterium]
MARKRMISPEIWDNQSFGELSLLAKILFIGMISQADDDGKGVLSAQLLKSRILPFDELRIADVDKALNEIGHNVSVAQGADMDKALNERGHKMSVVFYEVEGKRYYLFENWRKWQTINRPIPSKLPNPPFADGEGGGLRSHEVFNDKSMSTHEQLNEHSRAKEDIKEKKGNKYTHIEGEQTDFESQLNDFCQRWNVTVDGYSPLLAELDFEKLDKAYSESTKFLQVAPVARTLSWIVKNVASIYAGKYKDKSVAQKPKKQGGIIDSWRALHDKYEREENGDDT